MIHRVLLMRHARAGDAPRDEDRRLTREGREDAVRVAAALAVRGGGAFRVYASPLARASETATLLVRETGWGPVTIEPDLASGAALESLLAFLRSRRHAAVAIVGHMPEIGQLAGYLAWGERTRVLPLSPGDAVHLTVTVAGEAVRGTLDFHLTPPGL